MDLFTVKRFRPSANQKTTEEDQDSILQKLKAKAAKKEEPEHETENTTEEVEEALLETQPKKKKKKSKDREKAAHDESTEIQESAEVEVSEHVVKQKTKKRKNISDETEITPSDDLAEVSKETDESVKAIKKKKKRKKESTEDVQNVTEEKVNDDKETFDSAIGSSGVDEPLDSSDTPGFTLLGETEIEKRKPVKRVLPHWLDKPAVISSDLQSKESPIEALQGLSSSLVNKLRKNGITHFFPVQQHVIPRLLTPESAFRPNDLCVSAPTGSGKTLAFVLPVIQALSNKNVKRIRALVILPVHDLAVQVFRVFQQYTAGTSVKAALLSGQTTLANEQEHLIRKDRAGRFHVLADIVVATPGRLVDHIEKTSGFDLTDLRYLVIDEADRISEEAHSDWLQHVESAVYKNGRPKLALITPKHILEASMYPPLQKLLFSATLTSNPEKLRELQLFQPELFTAVVETQDEETGEFLGKYTTPKELTEFYSICDLTLKPLIVQHLILKNAWNTVLCFHSSRDSTHRLTVLLNKLGRLKASEFSADLSKPDRVKMLKEFSAGNIQVLVCTDAVARGMDLGVEAVISYDPPMFPKNYIHRVGRTARAGKPGTAVTLLTDNQATGFQNILSTVHKSDVMELKITEEELYEYEDEFRNALSETKTVLSEEQDLDKKSAYLKRKGVKPQQRKFNNYKKK